MAGKFAAVLNRTVVVMPALNEEASVATAVSHWAGQGVREVRIVDNGSCDATAGRAREAGASVIFEPNRGYGAAAWAGSRDVPPAAEWILFASAEGSDFLDAKSAEAFGQAVEKGARLVVGERCSRPEARRHLSTVQRFGNRLCCSLIALGWKAPRFRDMGSLRLIHADAFRRLGLRDRAFGWNIEMQVAAIEKRIPIEEVPVGYRPRMAGEPKISGSLRGSLRAGRDILIMVGKLWWRRKTEPRSRGFQRPAVFVNNR